MNLKFSKDKEMGKNCTFGTIGNGTRVNSYSNARVFWYFNILISKNYKIMNYGMKGQTDRME